MAWPLNGAPVPNWVKIAAFWIALGWIAAVQWSSKDDLSRKLGAKVDSLRVSLDVKTYMDNADARMVNRRLDALDDKVEDLSARVDWRYQQTRNAVGRLDDKIDPVIHRTRQRR